MLNGGNWRLNVSEYPIFTAMCWVKHLGGVRSPGSCLPSPSRFLRTPCPHEASAAFSEIEVAD